MTVGHRLSDKPTYGLKASVGETSSPFALFGTPGPVVHLEPPQLRNLG